MGGRLQISVGDLSELLRPALFVLAALASACVLADARRRFGSYAAAAWALLALLFPAVVLPLYLAARMFKRRDDPAAATTTSTDVATTDDETVGTPPAPEVKTPPAHDVEAPHTPGPEALTAHDAEAASVNDVKVETTPATGGETDDDSPSTLARARARAVAALKREALPLVYLGAVLLVGALYFYLDHASFDAHFARARQAKLYNQRERTVREFRAALRVSEDAHTRKLLGVELAEAGLWEEALAEFRAAARGGEPDDSLAYREAFALENLNRTAEAADAYRRFLQTQLCTRRDPDQLCAAARSRLGRLRPSAP